MTDFVEMFRHWNAGRSQVQIHQALNIDRKTILKYLAPALAEGLQPCPDEVFDEPLWRARIGRWFPELVDPAVRALTWPQIAAHHQWITDQLEVPVTVATIAQRLRDDHGVAVSESTVRRYIARTFTEERLQERVTVPRGAVEPGSEAQIDYGRLGMWLDPTSGRRLAVWVFAMILSPGDGRHRPPRAYLPRRAQPADPAGTRLRIRFVGMDKDRSGCVLVLPGGRVRSARPTRYWQLANLRMALFAGALRRRLGPDVDVQRVRYRLRGWNSPRLDALHDARAVLDSARKRFEPARIAVVGHSMGGRVAAHLAARGDVGTVVALAPWWVGDDGDLIPAPTRLLVVHGSADSWTDPGASRAQTERARQRGLDAQWVGLDGAGHYMVRRWREWHRLTAEFVAEKVVAA